MDDNETRPLPYKLAEGQITVRQLMEQLAALPLEQLDWPVETEGCDCTGPCSGIQANEAEAKVVYLLRAPD